MSVAPVTNAATPSIQQALAKGGLQSVAAAAVQEATETLNTTRQEAAKGDPVAIRKLAQLQQQEKSQESQHSHDTGKGARLNKTA